MAQTIHFICRREDNERKGLFQVEGRRGVYHSCCRNISDKEAESLIGGWLYLHQTKRERSGFGGRCWPILISWNCRYRAFPIV